MHWTRLIRDGKGHAGYLEEVCRRVMSFSNRLQGSGMALCDQMWKGFAARDPGLFVWVILDGDDKVIAHTVASMMPWCGEWVAWSYQTEVDDHQWAPREAKDAWIAEHEAWVRSWNEQVSPTRPDMVVQAIKLFTPNSARAMTRHTGFSVDGTLMHRRVK